MRNFVFILICVFLISGNGQFASAQTFKYEMRPFSSVGRVTGGKCQIHGDCHDAYLPKGKKFVVLCLTKKEAGGKRVDEKHIPNNGLVCGCLPDVKLCGYASAQEMYSK